MPHSSDKPLVSVIVPYFNQGAFLERAVGSARASYDGPMQIIVVNDGSTEPRSKSYLRSLARTNPDVQVVTQQNMGLSGARNTGLSLATGDFIQFLDSDDMLMPAKISRQVTHLTRTDRDISVCNYELCDEDQDLVENLTRDAIGQYDLELDTFLHIWERGFVIPIHCALIRATALQDTRFDTRVKGKEDWIFWSRLAARGSKFGYLPFRGAIYRQHASGMTKAKFKQMGEAWLQAAEIIAESVDATDEFLPSAEDWHRSFYQRNAANNVAAVSTTITTTPTPIPDTQERLVPTLLSASLPISTRPMFSVMVPIHNHYDHLLTCLSSIFPEIDDGAEVVLVDDGSTDPRVAALLGRLRAAHPALVVITLPENAGISAAQNEAIAHARGEYVCFVDCDDELVAGALRRLRQVLSSDRRTDYLFTNRVDIDEGGRALRSARYGGYEWLVPSGNIAHDLLDGMVASHLKVIRRETYVAVGGCDERYDGIQDWELALRVSRTGRMQHLDEEWYRHRIHQQSVTSSARVNQFRKTNEVRRRYGLMSYRTGTNESKDYAGIARQHLRSATSISVASNDDLLLLRPSELSSNGTVLRQTLGSNRIVVLWEDNPMTVSELNVVREWNSYFDCIALNNYRSAVALLGFLWDPRILAWTMEFPGVCGEAT